MTMFDKHLPEQILRKDDMEWNVSGLFAHDNDILTFMNIVQKELGAKNPISSVHGAPPVKWNSGRITRPFIKKELDATIEAYSKIKMPLYLTFSNHLLTVEDLKDPASNYLIDKIAETGMGGVILASDILSDYIHDKHPELKQIASIIRAAVHNGPLDKEYYESQGKKFDCVVFLPDDVFNYPLLESIEPKAKFEIIANEPCLVGCKVRRVHYALLAQHGKFDINLDEKSRDFEINRCISKPLSKQIAVHIGQSNASRTRNCNLTEDEINYIYDLGYRRFKLQGRNENRGSFLYDVTKYTLEPTIIAPLVYKAMVN